MLRQNLLRQQIVSPTGCQQDPEMIDPDLIHPLEYLIRHCDEQKTDHKSIAIRQLIREMKSMPDEIQLIDVEAEDQEHQKGPVK